MLNQKELLKRRQIEITANILQFTKASTAQAWVCSMIANLMTHAEDLREVKAAFVEWDTRKDGVLTEDEISEHMAEICSKFKMAEPDVRKILSVADVDRDGNINFNEFIAAALDKRKLLTDANLR